MKSSRTAALALAAALSLGLAACGGGSGGDSTSSTSTPPPTSATNTTESSSGPGGSLTPPGTQLKLGEEATVGWVPFSEDANTGAKEGIELKVSVEAIEKKSIGDLGGFDLEPEEKEKTPYFVKVRMEALGSSEPPEDEEPEVKFHPIDDRGQEAQTLIVLGSFGDCENTERPQPFTDGASYESCSIYLVRQGGSVANVQWNDGPSQANEITPYFDEPIVWAGS